jgi:hypothetical protein
MRPNTLTTIGFLTFLGTIVALSIAADGNSIKGAWSVEPELSKGWGKVYGLAKDDPRANPDGSLRVATPKSWKDDGKAYIKGFGQPGGAYIH